MTGKTLSIGRVTIDRYRRGGETVRTLPGGSAYNFARWLQDAGRDSALAATLGEDFPSPDGVRMSPCVRVNAPTFRVVIELSEASGDESRMEEDRGYELQPVDRPDERYDLVGLFSFEEPLLEPFEAADGRMKVYDPGEMTGEYEWSLVERGFEAADHVFLNAEEKRAVREIAPHPIDALPDEYGVETLVVTSKDAVRVHHPSGTDQFSVEPVDAPTDTVGAGDAFASRYVEGLQQGESLRERVTGATRRARRTVGHVGALPPRFWSDEALPQSSTQ